MRTISSADDALFTAVGGRASFLRVDVEDSGAVYRDLTTYPGENMVLAASWGESVDSPGMSGTVKLKREVELLSLAPLMDTSALNLAFNPAATPAPLVFPKRGLKIYTAVLPDGLQPGASDWRLAFHGKIDSIDWGQKDSIELKISDLQGDLRDLFIERERVYAHASPADPDATKGLLVFELGRAYALNELVMPTEANRNAHFYKVTTAGTSSTTVEPTWPTGGGSTVASGSVVFTEVGATTTSTGTAVETVLQQIATDNAASATVVTPSSPGWLIKWYLQERVNVWQAMRQLVDQIGYDLRYRYDSGSTSFKLTFGAIDRAKTSPDRTFSASEKLEVKALKLDVADIRNAVRIVYSNSGNLDANGNPIRAAVERTNSGSITLFGRRFMEIQESSSSNIDSQTEAEAMADAALADLALPTAEQQVSFEYFPFVELGDLYRFSGDALHHSGNLDLAVTGYTHTFDGTSAESTFTCRGKPSGGVERWLARAAEINPSDTHQLNLGNSSGLSIDTSDVVGGTKLTVAAATFGKHALALGFEVHLSKTNGFTPDSSSLVASVQGNEFVAGNLDPGETYYGVVNPFGFNAARKVRGLPSAQFSFVAGRAVAGHLAEGMALGKYPLNGGFETRKNGSGMPDHWVIDSGTLGTEVSVVEDGNGLSGNRYLRVAPTATPAGFSSAKIPLDNEMPEVNRYSGLFRVTAWVKNDAGNASGNFLNLDLYGYDYSGAYVDTLGALSIESTYKAGHWARVQTILKLDASDSTNRNIRSLGITATMTRASGTPIVDLDRVEIEYLGTPWYSIGDTSKFTDNYESIPAFGSGWSAYGSPHETPAIRKNQFGRVFIKGLATSSTHTLGTGNKIFVLPAGWIPPEVIHLASAGNGKFAQLEIDTSGNVYVGAADSATWAAYISIACSFELF